MPKKIIKMSDIMPPVKKSAPLAEKEIEIEEKTEERVEEEIKPELEIPEIIEPETPQIPRVEDERIFPEDAFVPKPKEKRKKALVTLGIVCLIILGFVFYFTLAKAEIIIKPKTETMHFQTELNVNKGVAFMDMENNKIPGQLFQVEKEEEREFLATQEKEVKEKAKGTITIYNQYSSAPQTLVKATRFISEKGKLFRTTQTIVIPGAKVEQGEIIPSTIDVKVVAAEPGEGHNIEPSSFTIPGFKGTAKYTGFYGRSIEPMTGGALGKVKVVSADDIAGAKDILTVELKREAKKELEKRIPSELKILKDTSLEEVIESSSSVGAEQVAEKFTIKIKVVAKILGFNESDAVSLINNNLKGKISENKVLIPDTIELSYVVANINLEEGTIRLTCEVKEGLAWKVDIKKIRQALAGKKEVEVRRYLSSRDEIESAKIIFWPFWVKKIPANENKIKITLE